MLETLGGLGNCFFLGVGWGLGLVLGLLFCLAPWFFVVWVLQDLRRRGFFPWE
jgi:hypothetical protein